MLIFFFITLTYFMVSCERIYSNSYNILSSSKIYHDLPYIFDGNLDSSSNIYLQRNETFSLAVELKEESLIDQVFIYADQNDKQVHEVRVGYSNSYEGSSVKYKCSETIKALVCKFPCTFGNSSIPIAGKYIFWSVLQNSRSSWVRINEISMEGASIKYDTKVDAVQQKPFRVENLPIEDERFCLSYYWKIFDKSSPRHTYVELYNLTVFFGRNFIVKILDIVLSSKSREEIELHFGFENMLTLKFNVNQDCFHEEDFDGFLRFSCILSPLGSIPVDQVTFFTENVSKLKIIGDPIHYPTLSLSSSEVDGVNKIPESEFTCTSVTCAGSCEPQGEVATCQGLMLMRKPISGGNASTVMRRGQLEPLWAKVLSDLKVIVDEESRLVVRIPKTYVFAGQYLCGCESTDAAKTLILSNPTALEQNDFLTEAIFQRNYNIEYRGKRQDFRNDISGLIELATEGKGGFFHMTARGFTFSYKLNVRVEWTEDSKRKIHESFHSTEASVKLYPEVEALANWTVSANRIVVGDIYPDARDNETVIYKWSLPNQIDNTELTDVFRVIDVDKKPVDPVRAWVVSRTDSLLHILVFCQHSDSNGVVNKGEIKVELMSHQCDPDAAPDLIAAFGLNGKEIVVDKIPEHSRTENMTYGLAANIVLREYSTFYRYNLQANVGEHRTTILDVMPSGIIRLKDELDAAKFDVSMTKYFTTPESDKIRVEIQVELLSSVLLDRLNCTRGSLKLTPKWDFDKAQNVTLKLSPTVFDFSAPKNLKRLNFTASLEVGESTMITEMSIPSPRYEKIDIEFDENTGLLSWNYVSVELRPAVSDYAVDVIFEDIGCGTQENITLSHLAALNCTKTGGCTTHLWSLEQLQDKRNILANYTIMINPKYVSFADNQIAPGTLSQLKFAHGERGRSVISVSAESASSRAQAVALQPSRKVPCERAVAEEMDASFELTAHALLAQGRVEMPLEGVGYTKLFPGTYGMGGIYRVANLQPGREYKIKGFVKYPGYLSDLISEEVTFTTPDEIVVPEKHILKDVGDSLLFNCSAVVGINPKFQKDVRWLRADQNGGSLPEGAFSRTAAFPDDRGFLTASLSIPQVDDNHAGVYCCAPEPPVEYFYGQTPRCAEFRLIVNDLKLDRYNMEANPGMAVSVTCSTKRDGDLQWRGPGDRVIPSSQIHHTAASNSTGWVQSLTLVLPEVRSDDVGDYLCWFQPREGEKRAPEMFSLRLEEALILRRSFQSASSLRFGELITLSCAPRIMIRQGSPRLRWYRLRPALGRETRSDHYDAILEAVRSSDDGQHVLIEETDASGEVILRVRLTPASQGRYVCVSFPDEFVDLAEEEELAEEKILQKAIQHTQTDVTYNSFVEISNPIRYRAGDEVILRCTGYPAQPGEHLEWAFKEFAVDAAYVFDDSSQGSFALADKERISQIMSCFRPNHTKSIANWPGAELYNPLSANHELYSPDEIEISVLNKFIENPVCQAAAGQLVCIYQKSKTIPLSPSLSSNPARSALLPEFGFQAKAFATTTEAEISLDIIRDAFKNEILQSSASVQNTQSNRSSLIDRYQILNYLVLAIISTAIAFHFV